MPLCQHVHLLLDRETAQLRVSHLLLFPSGTLTSVRSSLVGGLGPLPALTPNGRPTRNDDAGNAGAASVFPHPLSLLGVADPVPAVALSPSWEGKRCPTEGKGQRETHHQPSHAAEGTSSTPRTATAPSGWYPFRLHWHHHRIPVSLLCPLGLRKTCADMSNTVTVEATHSRRHVDG